MALPRILIVSTSHSTLGQSGRETGLDVESFAAPFYAFEDAGMTPALATIKGGAAPFDPAGLVAAEKSEIGRRFLADDRIKIALEGAPALRQVLTSSYDAVFLPGGPGAMWDFPASPDLVVALEQFALRKKPIAAVGHGVAALAPVMSPEGWSIVKDRRIACPLDVEEEAAGLAGVTPFQLEKKLSQLGAEIDTETPGSKVETDGLLVTGRNAASAGEAAAALMDILRAAEAQAA